MTTVQSAAPYRQWKRSRESFAALVCNVTSRLRNESTVLHMIRVAPWRRGAPKAQDRCASKRHPSMQRSVCQLCKVLLRIVIGSEAVGSLPHSYASKCAGRETKARYYMRYEQPLGDGSPAEGLPSLAPSKEAPSLPTRAPSYEAKRGAPKAQDGCASKRHPSTQRSV